MPSATQNLASNSKKEFGVLKLQTLAPSSYRVWRRQAIELSELNGWTDDLDAAALANLTVNERTAREQKRKSGVLQQPWKETPPARTQTSRPSWMPWTAWPWSTPQAGEA